MTTLSRPGAAEKYLRRVGSQRPNGLLYSDGVGAVVDLPHLTVVVQGLDYLSHRRTSPPATRPVSYTHLTLPTKRIV